MPEFTEASVRADVRTWLEANWNPDQGLVEWRNKLISSGWGVPTWPKDWFGMDLPAALAPVWPAAARRAPLALQGKFITRSDKRVANVTNKKHFPAPFLPGLQQLPHAGPAARACPMPRSPRSRSAPTPPP